MTKRELAEQFFMEGYNCTQAVVLAFADEMGVDKDDLLRLSSSFGGGFSRMREVCGAVSGIGMVAGALHPYENVSVQERGRHYAIVQKLLFEFVSKNGSVVCRDLLGAKLAATTPEPDERTPEYYKTRPCARLVGDAAEILEKHLSELDSFNS